MAFGYIHGSVIDPQTPGMYKNKAVMAGFMVSCKNFPQQAAHEKHCRRPDAPSGPSWGTRGQEVGRGLGVWSLHPDKHAFCPGLRRLPGAQACG